MPKVRRRPRRNRLRAKHQFFRNPSAHCPRENIFQVINTLITSVFRRQKPRHPAGRATRNNRHLMHRVRIWQHMPHNRMPRLVISRNFALFFIHHLTFSLRPNRHSLKRLGQIPIRNRFMPLTRRRNRRLVRDIRQIRPRRPRRLFRQRL